jgi:hypothetical protein
MFDIFDDNDDPQHKVCTIDGLRSLALIIFGRYLCKRENIPPNDELSTRVGSNFLSIQETENILREKSQHADSEFIGIGGDTAEEANEELREVLLALCQRILSNVLAKGVSEELLNCHFNGDRNDFEFELTEKGYQIANSKRDVSDED